jgi:hypothetical protein
VDEATARAIGEIEGRLGGHDAEIGGLRAQASRIESGVGRVEGMLKSITGSGPQVALSSSQPATEPIDRRPSSAVARVLNGRHGLHVIYGVLLLLAVALLISAHYGKSLDELARGKTSTATSRPALIPTPETEE